LNNFLRIRVVTHKGQGLEIELAPERPNQFAKGPCVSAENKPDLHLFASG
jgi:hypothetical protein